MEEKNDKYSKLIIVLIIIAIVIFGGLVATILINKARIPDLLGGEESALVDCTSTTADKPQKVVGWNTYMYPSVNDSEKERYDNQTVMQESYSYAKLNDKTEINNVYYRVQLENMGDLPRDTRKIIEFCDENNKTVKTGTTRDTLVPGAAEGVQASVSKLATYYMQNRPGIYRLDGYLFTNGKWTLTNRIDAIKLSE